MLEYVDLDQSVPKEEYQQRLPALQERLYGLEEAVYRGRVPVALVFEGWAAAGKGSTINLLAERLDPRGFRVVPVTPPRTAEMAYPWLWRFWLKTPADGQMVVYDTSWYRRVLIDRITKTVSKREWQGAYDDIRDFESQLAADGTVILKFWIHISKKVQGQRFKKLRAHKLTAWQVTDEDDAQHKAYKQYLAAVEDMLARTEAPYAPWTIVAATDRYYTRVKVMETIIQALEFRLGKQAPPPSQTEPAEENASAPAEPEPALPHDPASVARAIAAAQAAEVAEAAARSEPAVSSEAAAPQTEDGHA
jgi:polyphosphate kinase 2 (PPK2 family)